MRPIKYRAIYAFGASVDAFSLFGLVLVMSIWFLVGYMPLGYYTCVHLQMIAIAVVAINFIYLAFQYRRFNDAPAYYRISMGVVAISGILAACLPLIYDKLWG
jgi:hypothetical protein